MNIRIDRPSLNRGSAEANVALIDKWIADTSDKLNLFVSVLNAEGLESKDKTKDLIDRIEALKTDLDTMSLVIAKNIIETDTRLVIIEEAINEIREDIKEIKEELEGGEE